MVDAPEWVVPLFTNSSNARPAAKKSIPEWTRNRLSSALRVAAMAFGEMSLNEHRER
jgi:hypothetical protein